MATIKIKFRPSTNSDGEGKIFYRIIHNRKTCQITTDYSLLPEEWDDELSQVIIPDCKSSRYAEVSETDNKIIHDIKKLNSIINKLVNNRLPFSVTTVATKFLDPGGSAGIISYAESLIKRLERSGKECTAKTYSSVISRFKKFCKTDLDIDEITNDDIIAFESFLQKAGLCPNSTSYHMRNLRAIYNRAVEEGLTKQNHPFRRVYTGIAKTIKRAIPLSEVRKIKRLPLENEPSLQFARDIFMFSFYTRGMSIIDISYLKKTDLSNGFITYRRKKTGQTLTIKWEKPMQDIVKSYSDPNSSYLLPILDDNCKDTRKRYQSKAQIINRNLKEVAKRVGLRVPLTLYVARHCWASAARFKNIPLAVISEGMGHDSEKTTLIYLSSIDTSTIDKANNLIIKAL